MWKTPALESIAWKYFSWRTLCCGRTCRGFSRIRFSWALDVRRCRHGISRRFARGWRCRRRPPARISPLKYEQRVWSAIILDSHYGFRSPDNLSGDFEAGQLFARGAEIVPFAAGGKRANTSTRAGVRAKTVRSRRQDREIDGGGRSADRLREPTTEFEGRIAARGFRFVQFAARHTEYWRE